MHYLVTYRYAGTNQIDSEVRETEKPIRCLSDIDALGEEISIEKDIAVIVLAFSELPGQGNKATGPAPAYSVGDRIMTVATLTAAEIGALPADSKGTITHFIYPYIVFEDDAQGYFWQALPSEIVPAPPEDNAYKTTLGAFIEALQIFAANLPKGLSTTYVLSAEHDEIIGPNIDRIALDSAPGRRLQALGWHVGDADAWSRFV